MNPDSESSPLEEAVASLVKEVAEKTLECERHEEPFICLGLDGPSYVYWVRRSESIVKLTALQHTKATLINLASSDYWREICGEKWHVADAIEYCYEQQGNKRYSPNRLRGIGIWSTKGRPIYNAGDVCFRLDEGRIVEMDHGEHDGYIYKKLQPELHPDSCPLDDEGGSLLLDFFNAHAWREEHGGFLLAGIMVQGLLAGYLDFRAHCWINAPASAGKTKLCRDIQELIGHSCVTFEGIESTEASIRQTLADGARFVLFDEAEEHAGHGPRRSLSPVITYLRSCTMGGKIRKGTIEGTARSFTAQSSFLMLSINTPLRRESDVTRFLFLHLQKLQGEEFAQLMQRQLDARNLLREKVSAAKLLARILCLAPLIGDNAKLIQEYLMQHGQAGRRAELFGVVLAGAYSLKSGDKLTEVELQECLSIANASAVDTGEESDSFRCLSHILEYIPPGGDESVNELIQNPTRSLRNRLARCGIKVVEEQNRRFVFVAPAHSSIRQILRNTDWENSCKDSLRNFDGAVETQRKLQSRNYRGILIPWEYINQDE